MLLEVSCSISGRYRLPVATHLEGKQANPALALPSSGSSAAWAGAPGSSQSAAVTKSCWLGCSG